MKRRAMVELTASDDTVPRAGENRIVAGVRNQPGGGTGRPLDDRHQNRSGDSFRRGMAEMNDVEDIIKLL